MSSLHEGPQTSHNDPKSLKKLYSSGQNMRKTPPRRRQTSWSLKTKRVLSLAEVRKRGRFQRICSRATESGAGADRHEQPCSPPWLVVRLCPPEFSPVFFVFGSFCCILFSLCRRQLRYVAYSVTPVFALTLDISISLWKGSVPKEIFWRHFFGETLAAFMWAMFFVKAGWVREEFVSDDPCRFTKPPAFG